MNKHMEKIAQAYQKEYTDAAACGAVDLALRADGFDPREVAREARLEYLRLGNPPCEPACAKARQILEIAGSGAYYGPHWYAYMSALAIWLDRATGCYIRCQALGAERELNRLSRLSPEALKAEVLK